MAVGYTAGMMVREEKALYEFERREAARLESVLTPSRALQMYDAMWELAKDSGALRRDDPLEGIEVAIEVARTVNSLAGDRNV
jgi:hypothetical protein